MTETVMPNKPTRVLQVLGGLQRGGAETWLVQLMDELESRNVSMDYVVYEDRKYDYSETVQGRGAQIFVSGRPSNPVRYVKKLDEIIRRNGPYDVVHSHLNELSGLVLAVAKRAGVPTRIAHSHIERRKDMVSLLRRGAYPPLTRLIAKQSTHRIGCSAVAASSVFRPDRVKGSPTSVIHCGIDLEPFRTKRASQRSRILRDLDLSEDVLVVGHVGRFEEQKNHQFILEIARDLSLRKSSAVLLLVGKGELQESIRVRVKQMGLEHQVYFLGLRSDVPDLMTNVFDVFLFPSLHEGLPITLIEAQAAGLPCLISTSVSEEAAIVPGLVRRLPLTAPVSEWTDELLKLQALRPSSSLVDTIASTDFSIRASAERVYNLYIS